MDNTVYRIIFGLSINLKTTCKMIYLIEVPHQRPAFLSSFTSTEDILNYANNHCDEVIETEQEAKEFITHDLHIGFWIESVDDKRYAQSWNGHQSSIVQAIADGIDDTDLSV